MHRVLVLVGSIVLSGLILPASGSAQRTATLELRGGMAHATSDFAGADLDGGWGGEAMAALRVLPTLAVYGRWGDYRFGAEDSVFGPSTRVRDTGFALGIGYLPEIRASLGGWIRGGAIFGRVEVTNDSGAVIADSDGTLGWELGGGVSYPIREGLAFTPGVRFRTFEPVLDFGASEVVARLSYVAFEAAVELTFPVP